MSALLPTRPFGPIDLSVNGPVFQVVYDAYWAMTYILRLTEHTKNITFTVALSSVSKKPKQSVQTCSIDLSGEDSLSALVHFRSWPTFHA